jgi:hypothetical protein
MYFSQFVSVWNLRIVKPSWCLHPQAVPIKVCEQKSSVMQYSDLSPSSIYGHKLRWTTGEAISGFDCIIPLHFV